MRDEAETEKERKTRSVIAKSYTRTCMHNSSWFGVQVDHFSVVNLAAIIELL